jgi:hypothetical protein
MSHSESSFSQFAVEATTAAKRAKKVDELKQRKSLSAEASGKTTKAQVISPQDLPKSAVADEVPFHKRPVSAEQVERVLGKRKPAATNVDDDEESKRKLAIQKYRGYFNSPHTRQFCGDAPNDSWPLSVALAHLQRARDNADARSQLDLTAVAVEGAIKGAEFMVHSMGVNPFEWQLVNSDGVRASQVFRAHKDSPEFQPALDEVGAEIGLTFKANCYMRLGAALFGFLQGFSNEAKSKKARTSVAETP